MEILVDERSFLQSIYYGSDQAIFVIDVTEDGDFIFAGLNPAHEKASGIRSADIKGKTPEDLVPDITVEAAKELRHNYSKCLRAGKTIEYEEMITMKGKDRYWLTRLSSLKDEKGRVYRIVGASTEITNQKKKLEREKKKYLEQLSQTEKMYRSFVENYQGIVLRSHLNWIPIFCHGAVEQITGYTEKDLISGKPRWDQIIYAEDLANLKKNYPPEKFSDPGFSCNREYRIIRKDGEIRWIHDYLQVFCDDQGKPDCIQGAVYDITEWKEAERIIKDSEQQFKAIFEQAAVGISRLDQSMKFLAVNEKLCGILGYRKEELLQINCQDLTHSEDLTINQAELSKIFTGKTDHFSMENRYKRKDGSYIWANFAVSVIRDPAGKPDYFIGIIEDIDWQKRAEIALAESEQRYELITESSDLGIWDWFVDTEEVYYNKEWKNQVGYAENELENNFSTWESLLHPDDKEWMLKKVHKYLENPKGLFLAEFRLRHKDGSFRWISNRAASQKNTKGQLVRMFGAHTDITEKRITEELIKGSEEKFRSLFEDALDMIHIVDHEGNITDVNRIELETLGYTKEELLGRNFMEFVHPETHEITRNAFQKLSKGGNIDKYETVMVNKSGKKIFVQVTAVPEIKEGVFKSSRAIIRNVTDLRMASLELAVANKQLIEKNRELEQIVYVTSHDLRSPLVNIQGFNQELEMSIQDLKKTIDQLDKPGELTDELDLIMNQEIPEAIDFIKTGIYKMDNLLKGLLTISRLGRRPMEIKRIDMNLLIRDVIKNSEYRIKENEINVSTGDLPDCKGDENQINQVFSNLMENAIKYRNSERSSFIKISGRKENGQLIYEVSDNGIGIPRNKHDRIFEIFYQNEPGKVGEGLGLTIVRKIIEKHQGRIHVESEPGKGSIFILTLPYK